MNNFETFLERMQEKESKSILAIRNGIGIKKDFWSDFLLLLNNSEAVADLLGVSVEKVSTWRNNIHHHLNKVKKLDNEMVTKEKGKLLKTGLPEDK